MNDEPKSEADRLLRELGFRPMLTVYLGAAPGAGKTHRLLCDALNELHAGRRVAIGWIETKHRPRLDEMARSLPRIPPRVFTTEHLRVEDFDLEAAIASPYELIILDELAHMNPPEATHAKRWQDALALRSAGKSVLTACNILHIDTVAAVAERAIGAPVRELVPLSLLAQADRVIALDVTPSMISSRLLHGRLMHENDRERAEAGVFAPKTLHVMRELLLRTVDALTVPVIAGYRASTAIAIVEPTIDVGAFLNRAERVADALDLSLEATVVDIPEAARDAIARDIDAAWIPEPEGIRKGKLDATKASLVILAHRKLAERMLAEPLDRSLLVIDPARSQAIAPRMRSPVAKQAGKLTIFFGAIAGSGKTYAMLDRAHHLLEEGVDVLAALIETHGRKDTAKKLEDIPCLARTIAGELDVESLLLRSPKIALIDEFAHTNRGDAPRRKRYQDVLHVLQAGIDVYTTLNVQHIEGVSDAVERLTGLRVAETLPDHLLESADEIVFIDVAPEVLRERLRAGKIYFREAAEAALQAFFRTENVTALRELCVRETLRARGARRPPAFERIVLAVAPRERDTALIRRIGAFAKRVGSPLRVISIAKDGRDSTREAIDVLAQAASDVGAEFIADIGDDPAGMIVALARPGDVIVAESPRAHRGFFGRRSFAIRLLAAGANEVLVMSPR